MKRIFDLIVIVLAFPLWEMVLIIVYLINITLNKLPGFYKSTRVVSNNSEHDIYKFRTMKKIMNRDTIPYTESVFYNIPITSNAYTKFDLIVEKFGLTEIPQLIHIFSGIMSVVGSRPPPRNVYIKLIDKDREFCLNRFLTKPGLTGLPQLVGRDNLSDIDRLTLESSYSKWAIDNYKWSVDFLILFYTVCIVINIKKPMTTVGALKLLKQ
jgi:lipopolysaccharide/colanic/teichoic acid biosynthesis glycosyltransferase